MRFQHTMPPCPLLPPPPTTTHSCGSRTAMRATWRDSAALRQISSMAGKWLRRWKGSRRDTLSVDTEVSVQHRSQEVGGGAAADPTMAPAAAATTGEEVVVEPHSS